MSSYIVYFHFNLEKCQNFDFFFSTGLCHFDFLKLICTIQVNEINQWHFLKVALLLEHVKTASWNFKPNTAYRIMNEITWWNSLLWWPNPVICLQVVQKIPMYRYIFKPGDYWKRAANFKFGTEYFFTNTCKLAWVFWKKGEQGPLSSSYSEKTFFLENTNISRRNLIF